MVGTLPCLPAMGKLISNMFCWSFLVWFQECFLKVTDDKIFERINISLKLKLDLKKYFTELLNCQYLKLNSETSACWEPVFRESNIENLCLCKSRRIKLRLSDALRDLALFVLFKKNMKNTYGGVLHLVKFQVKPGLRFLIRHFFFFFLFVVRSKYLFLSFIHKKNYHLNIILFKPGQIVRLDKVNVRPDIRQNLFLKKIWTLRVCVALKTIWNYFTLINIKLRQAHFCQHSVEPQ